MNVRFEWTWAGSAGDEYWAKAEQDISKIVGMVVECLIVDCRMLLVKEMERSGGSKGDEVMKASWKRHIAISRPFLKYEMKSAPISRD